MKIKDVAKLSPEERFLYWIKERHAIYLKRKAGKPKPWTDDEVLQSYFFTNPYRENDKTTVWFRENIREPLRDDPAVLFATVCFRWFNLIATGYHLKNNDLLTKWNRKRAIKLLNNLRAMDRKVFTGAFMIPAEPGTKKIEHVCNRLQPIWDDRKRLVKEIRGSTLQNAHEQLVEYPYLGGFMAYEVVTDLRYTYLLEGAKDKLTWCNSGPGCARGLLRLQSVDLKGVPAAQGCKVPKDYLRQMRELRRLASKRLSGMPRFEMREIEHSLCEFDKFERARLGDGKLKRRYAGT